MSLSESKKKTFIYLLILGLPFIFFCWMIPFISSFTIGSDYLLFSLIPQMELLFSIKSGSFPLYVPGFAGGHSSSALTLGQIFHPLPYLASIMPGYWNGKAIEWNNFLKLLSLGLAHLALFGFLRKIRLSLFFSFLLSLITVYNLRVPDLYRFGASLEAYTAFLVLCAAIGWYVIKPTKWLGPLCIIAATYLLVCSGHPQMMYYGFLGVVLFVLVSPFFVSTMLPEKQVDFKSILKNWAIIGMCLCLGIILSSAYVLPFYFDFLKMNIDRVGQDYAWADNYPDSFIGTLNNAFLPLHSDTYSAFGGSSLILIAAVLPLLRFFKIKIPRSIWAIWGMLFFMFLYMQGSRTPVHKLAWEYLPFASNFRIAGRISIIMPFFIMLLLTWVVKTETSEFRIRKSSVTLLPSVILAYISLTLMFSYYLLCALGYNLFSFFHKYFINPAGAFFDIHYLWVSSIIVVFGITALIIFAVYSSRNIKNSVLSVVLIIATFAQLWIALIYRSEKWTGKKYDSFTFEEMQKQKKTNLDYIFNAKWADPGEMTFRKLLYPGAGMHSSIVENQINQSFLEPFLGKIFTQVIPVENSDEAYEKMRHDRLPHQVFVERYNQEKARALSAGAKDMKEALVKLTYSSSNRLKFSVNSEAPVIFGLSYPYSGNWRIRVNGERVHVYRANGAAHAVEIPKGESVIEFRYWSNALFWGMLITCSTFAVIGIFVCFRGLNSLPRIIGIIIILSISAGGFMLWYNSLYSGDNLETEYSWTYSPPSKEQNLAYGKNSWVNDDAIPKGWYFKKISGISNFVDGDKSPRSGYLSRPCDNPAWFLDLRDKKYIKTINVYESEQAPLVNRRPLEISFSDDGDKWRHAVSFESLAQPDVPTRIDFERPQNARYIRINATGKSMLSFDEVEVYGLE
ncbi:MAG: YfhO family protein [Nitrospirae bacterium]|nr:YfhO family protein [Nitrospirota bacterium]